MAHRPAKEAKTAADSSQASPTKTTARKGWEAEWVSRACWITRPICVEPGSQVTQLI